MLAHDYGVYLQLPLEVPKVVLQPPEKQQKKLRISAGKAAIAAGIHPYTDVGDLFLELLYQDLPELLLHDAALAGVEVISNADERERLLEKSGAAMVLEAILKDATRAE